MSNRLKKVFSHEDPSEHLLTLKFDGQTSKEEFKEKLERMYKSAEPQTIEGISSVIASRKAGDVEIPFMQDENIQYFVISPPPDEICLKAINNGVEYKWIFERAKTNKVTTLRSINDGIVDVVIKFDNISNKATFDFKINYVKAESMKAIEEACARSVALLKYLFLEDGQYIDKSVANWVERLESVGKLYKAVAELDSHLEKKLLPSEIKGTKEETQTAYKLFFMIVKRAVLRGNYRLNTFSVPYTGDKGITELIPGQPMLVSYRTTEDHHLFGRDISVYLNNILYNVKIGDVDDDEMKKQTTITLHDLESNPAYVSYRGFLSEEERDKEGKRILDDPKNGEEYADAKRVEELVAQDF